MKRLRKKLAVKKETIQSLAVESLAGVVGRGKSNTCPMDLCETTVPSFLVPSCIC